METLELFFRFGAITLLAATALLMLRDLARMPAAQFFMLFAAGMIGFLATHASVDIALPAAVFIPLSVLSKLAALFIWWFVFALFVDGFRLGRMEIAFAAVWAFLVLFDFPPLEIWFPVIAELATTLRVVMSAGLAVYIIARLLADLSIDLWSPGAKPAWGWRPRSSRCSSSTF